MELRTVDVTRYIMPLREGGSLPALAEAAAGSGQDYGVYGALW
mgnify:CR=1 FL=1